MEQVMKTTEQENAPSLAWTEDSVLEELIGAEAERRSTERFTLAWEDLDLDTAYRIQAKGITRRIVQGGERIGVKLGLTSFAKQKQMGVSAPITGILTDDMLLFPGEPIPLGELIHPKVEPEIVFVLGEDLRGPGIDAAAAGRAVARVHAGIEIIDSRYRAFDFRLPDVVADNASSARFAIGDAGLALAECDLIHEHVVLRIDGEIVAEATGEAVLGDPLRALAFAANELAARGDFLRAGEIVLTGAMTDAREIAPGANVSVDFSTLGTVSLKTAPTPMAIKKDQ
jgi:2-oxo-3-hexenedioate decarboxylase